MTTTISLCRSCLRSNGDPDENDLLLKNLEEKTQSRGWKLVVSGCKRVCPPVGTSIVVEQEDQFPCGRLSMSKELSVEKIMKEAESLIKNAIES